MLKADFLKMLHRERAMLNELINGMDGDMMTVPGTCGRMSVKDLIVHIMWYERETTNILEQRALVGSEWWQLPPNERNERIQLSYFDRPLGTIFEESCAIFERLVRAVHRLPESAMTNPAMFDDMPANWKPWQAMAANTFEHYQDHAVALRAWCRLPEA